MMIPKPTRFTKIVRKMITSGRVNESILYVGHHFVHARAAVLERRQDEVCRHRRSTESVLTNRVEDRVHDRTVPGADRWLADTARADRRFGIGDVERQRLHLRRDVEDRQRTVVVEALRERHTVVLVVDPALRQRVTDPEIDAAKNLAV